MPTEVENALELRLALKKYMPDLSKETQKEMANALRPVVARARGFIPSDSKLLSGWVKGTASMTILLTIGRFQLLTVVMLSAV
jgi:hypothetical protein